MKTASRGRVAPEARPKSAVARGDRRGFLPLLLPAIFTVVFAGFTLLPRVNGNANLTASFWGAAAFLAAGLAALFLRVRQTGRNLKYEFVPRRVHWVQMLMHSSVYAYWGWYWREVYHEVPLILAQVAFLYALDMLVCWSRRDTWILGFGPIPIIFSMNLFLWFRDDWFYLQFVMVALIVFGKEFLRWKRDGQGTHIFNPSAFALFVTSIVLIATHNTPITWGDEIATTFLNPPKFFLEMFVLGLIVQALFSVTLVTLSAAAMLYLLNIVYTSSTGTYMFIDTNIHPAVFLGLYLLVTDPATSPRKNFGKVVFGAAYGAGIFALVPILEGLGAPVFYDKLLCVPLLNLTVRALDRLSVAVSVRVSGWKLRPLQALAAWTPRQANYAFMAIWVALFAFMLSTGFVGTKHPGSNPAVWEKACGTGNTRACDVLARTLDVQCQHDSANGCFALGELLNGGKGLPRNKVGAGRSLKHACDLGLNNACLSLVNIVQIDGDDVLLEPCNSGDGRSCYMLGSMYYGGQGVRQDLPYSAKLFEKSCTVGFTRACGQLGESYLFGEGVPKDLSKAKEILEKACDAGYGPGCFNVGIMERQGIETPRNESLAAARFRQGCNLGEQKACQALGPAALASR